MFQLVVLKPVFGSNTVANSPVDCVVLILPGISSAKGVQKITTSFFQAQFLSLLYATVILFLVTLMEVEMPDTHEMESAVMTEPPKAPYAEKFIVSTDQEPSPRLMEWRLGHPSPRLLAIRLRDARARYEQVFDHPPPLNAINALDGWDQVAWMEHAIAEVHIPKGPSTYTPPAPYRVFRVVTDKDGK